MPVNRIYLYLISGSGARTDFPDKQKRARRIRRNNQVKEGSINGIIKKMERYGILSAGR